MINCTHGHVNYNFVCLSRWNLLSSLSDALNWSSFALSPDVPRPKTATEHQNWRRNQYCQWIHAYWRSLIFTEVPVRSKITWNPLRSGILRTTALVPKLNALIFQLLSGKMTTLWLKICFLKHAYWNNVCERQKNAALTNQTRRSYRAWSFPLTAAPRRPVLWRQLNKRLENCVLLLSGFLLPLIYIGPLANDRY